MTEQDIRDPTNWTDTDRAIKLLEVLGAKDKLLVYKSDRMHFLERELKKSRDECSHTFCHKCIGRIIMFMKREGHI